MNETKRPTVEQREAIAKELKEVRTRLGLTQSDLGFILGVNGSSISNVETANKDYGWFLYTTVLRWIQENAREIPRVRKHPEEDPEDILTGTWNGIPIQLKAQYKGHTFTREEWDELLAGYTIIIRGLYKWDPSTKTYDTTGDAYDMILKLGDIQNKYGITRTGYVELGWIRYTTRVEPEELPHVILAPDPEEIASASNLLQRIQEEVLKA